MMASLGRAALATGGRHSGTSKPVEVASRGRRRGLPGAFTPRPTWQCGAPGQAAAGPARVHPGKAGPGLACQ